MLSTINQQLLLRNSYIQIIVLSKQGNTKMYRAPLSSRSFESKNIRNWPSFTMVWISMYSCIHVFNVPMVWISVIHHWVLASLWVSTPSSATDLSPAQTWLCEEQKFFPLIPQHRWDKPGTSKEQTIGSGNIAYYQTLKFLFYNHSEC